MKTACGRCSRFVVWMLALAGLLGTQVCRAGTFDMELRITPEVPRPFQAITVHALQDPCYRFGLSPTTYEVLEGNIIRVVVPYEGNLFCPPVPVVPFHWTIPGLPSGSYRLELLADSQGAPEYYLLDAIDIQIGLGIGPEPQLVPSASWIGLGALALLLMFAAHWSCGRRY